MSDLLTGYLLGVLLTGAVMVARELQHRRQLRAARQDTINQVKNCLELVDSIEAQLDREKWRNQQEPDWNALVAPLFERK